MATYTPSAIVTQVALTASNVSYLTGSGGTTYIVRTWHFSTPSAGKLVTASIKADAAGTRVFEALPLTQNVPSIYNGWWPIAGAAAHDIDASCAATAASIGVYGYTYA